MPKWLQLMRTGSFTDRHGNRYDVTADHLNEIQKNYRNEDPAHLVVGHPDKPKVPSFGIVDALKVVGDKLLFKPGRLVPEFAALVAKGGFPSVSAGLTKSLDRLDHIAFLSAQRPAIDGLEPICEFSAAAESAVAQLDITDAIAAQLPEFSVDGWLKWRLRDIGSVFRRWRESIVEKEGVDAADKIIPDYLVTSLQEDPPEEVVASPSFSMPEGGSMTPEQKAILDAEIAKNATLTQQLAEFSAAGATAAQTIAALTAEVASLKAIVKKFESDTMTAEFSVFVEKLITDKKVLPDHKTALVGDLVTMAGASRAPEFSASPETSPLEIFKRKLEALPATVPGGEHTAKTGPEFSGDESPVDRAARARALMDEEAAKGITISASDAVARLSKK